MNTITFFVCCEYNSFNRKFIFISLFSNCTQCSMTHLHLDGQKWYQKYSIIFKWIRHSCKRRKNFFFFICYLIQFSLKIKFHFSIFIRRVWATLTANHKKKLKWKKRREKKKEVQTTFGDRIVNKLFLYGNRIMSTDQFSFQRRQQEKQNRFFFHVWTKKKLFISPWWFSYYYFL